MARALLPLAAALPLAAGDPPGAGHWSFQPVVRPAPPAVTAEGWARGPLDRLVLARLVAAAPAPPRDARRDMGVFAGEFGRTPLGENRVGRKPNTGRDHHPFAFSVWLAVDHEGLTYRYQGRDFRLTDVAGRVVQPLLA